MRAPVKLDMFRYHDLTTKLWDMLQGDCDVMPYQIQITHEAQRSITVNMKDSFEEFLTKAHKDDETIAPNLCQLEREAKMQGWQ